MARAWSVRRKHIYTPAQKLRSDINRVAPEITSTPLNENDTRSLRIGALGIYLFTLGWARVLGAKNGSAFASMIYKLSLRHASARVWVLVEHMQTPHVCTIYIYIWMFMHMVRASMCLGCVCRLVHCCYTKECMPITCQHRIHTYTHIFIYKI